MRMYRSSWFWAVLTVVLIAIPAALQAQTLVDFTWSQPDSSSGMLLTGNTICCKRALPDGDIDKYEIFVATPSDTLYWGFVNAPHIISNEVIAAIPVEMFVPTSVAVRAVDIRGRAGPFSSYSAPITVDPGGPESPSKPEPVRVYFGG